MARRSALHARVLVALTATWLLWLPSSLGQEQDTPTEEQEPAPEPEPGSEPGDPEEAGAPGEPEQTGAPAGEPAGEPEEAGVSAGEPEQTGAQAGEPEQAGVPAPAGEPAQPGVVRGTVVEKGTGQPVIGATVVLLGTDLAALTEADGGFAIAAVPPGAYQVQVVSYEDAEALAQVEVEPGGTVEVSLSVDKVQFAGEVVVVTGTRSPEKIFDAPLTVEAVSEEDMERSGGTSYLSALADVKGIDFADAGINEQRISARGFTTQFNSRMLSMVDGRMAQIPGNGLPQANLLPTSSLDMKAIEVVVGPASALYGANAHTGVVNVITKTPWDQSGASVAVRGGGRSLIDGSLRLAGTVRDDLGWKINAQYMRADDFVPDPDEPTHYYGTDIYEGDLVHDYSVKSIKTDASLYYRFSDWFAKASYGFSENDGFSLTNAGRNHIRGWRIQYQNVQLSNPNWYAQFTRTQSDAGGTYQLNRLAGIAQTRQMEGDPIAPEDLDPIRDDIKFVDQSQLLDSELQYRDTFAGISTAVGAQWRLYLPNSGGTYLADASGEDIDAMELGGYVQLDYSLLEDRLRLVGAARIDNHTNYSTQISPKASAVYSITPEHKIRAGYNRAFKSPTILENYLFINKILLGNRNGFTIRDADGNVLSEIAPLEPEEVNALELGYKGMLGRRLFIDAVIYNSWYENFISPLTQVANPAEGTYGYYDDGTIVAAGEDTEGTLFTYTNFGEAQVRGADLGVNVYPMDHLTVSASTSWISLVSFTNDTAQNDLLLNVPEFKLKGGITVQDLGMDNYFVRIDGRYHAAYQFESGYWSSSAFYDDDKVPARFVTDLTAGYDLPDLGLSLRAHLMNVLDNQTVDVLGAPTPRRLFYVQAIYEYPGLAF